MKIEIVKIDKIKANSKNPRIIKDDKFKKLVESIKSFPEMLNIRPIVVDENMVILGGNMRFRACQDAGMKDVPIIKADALSDEKKEEFVIKDNVSSGAWDFEMLANDFDMDSIGEWGIDLPKFDESKDDENDGEKEGDETEKPNVIECPKCRHSFSVLKEKK